MKRKLSILISSTILMTSIAFANANDGTEMQRNQGSYSGDAASQKSKAIYSTPSKANSISRAGNQGTTTPNNGKNIKERDNQSMNNGVRNLDRNNGSSDTDNTSH